MALLEQEKAELGDQLRCETERLRAEIGALKAKLTNLVDDLASIS